MKKYLIILICLCALMGASCASKTEISEKQNSLAQAIRREGDAFRVQGNYAAALSKLLEAEEMAPDDPVIQNSLGLAYIKKRRPELAITAFKKALDLKPDYTEAMNNLGVTYLIDEKYGIAIKTFNKVLKDVTYPYPHSPLANIGWAYLNQNQYPKAQQYFLKALRERPDFVQANHGLAQVYLRTGQTDRAVSFLSRTILQYPNTAIFHADLAEAHEANGHREKAVKSWQTVLHLTNKNSGLHRKAQQRLFELE